MFRKFHSLVVRVERRPVFMEWNEHKNEWKSWQYQDLTAELVFLISLQVIATMGQNLVVLSCLFTLKFLPMVDKQNGATCMGTFRTVVKLLLNSINFRVAFLLSFNYNWETFRTVGISLYNFFKEKRQTLFIFLLFRS